MQRSKCKNANPKKVETLGFSRCPNPGFRFGKMSGLPGYPGFLKPRFQSLVLNAAARVITNTKKYESGLSRTLHHDLHWLDVTVRIQFRVAATVYQCLHSMAPVYLTELCTPVTASASRLGGLRSVTTNNLIVPRCRLSTY